MLSGCAGKGQSSDAAGTSAQAIDSIAPVTGEWILEHVVVNDTLDARPADFDPSAAPKVWFNADGTFSFNTDCNSCGGHYRQTGDSIRFEEVYFTEMACEHMETETLLKRVLPQVKLVDWNNDSILRLDTDSSAYIVLKRVSAGE